MEFPPEVLEIIFSFLDGKSLNVVSRVNRLWNSEINRISSRRNLWRDCCRREIEPYILEEMSVKNNFDLPVVGSYLETQLPDKSGNNWRLAYTNWYRWSVVSQWPSLARTVCIPKLTTSNEAISCVKITGDCVVTGHAFGCIMLWSPCSGLIATGVPHKGKVMDMLLVSLSGEARDIGSDPLTDEIAHELVISTSEDETIAVTWLSKHTVLPSGERRLTPGATLHKVHAGCTHAIRSLTSNLFLVKGEDMRVSAWEVTSGVPEVQLIFCSSLDSLVDSLLIKSVPNQIVQEFLTRATMIPWDHFVMWRKRMQNLQEFLNEAFPVNFNKIHISMDYANRMLNIEIKSYESLTSCNKEWKYNTLGSLPSEPTCWLLYGQVLLLGLSSGSVHMYRARDADDLDCLDLKCASWQVGLGPEPIIKLDVADGKRGPQVVAATRTQVYLVAFHSPSGDQYQHSSYDPFELS